MGSLSTPAVEIAGRAAESVDARTLRKVILAASLGTLFEWCDFYLHGSLAICFGTLFFPSMGLEHFSNPDGRPAPDPAQVQFLPMLLLLTLQRIYVCMVYGPIAAFLVELFPTRIRYTSMSLPYHLGNGWFGGFLPLIATAVTSSAWAQASFGEHAIYTGLIYPIAVCLLRLLVGGLFVEETRGNKIDDDALGPAPG